MTEDEEKEAFARLFLKEVDPFKAALELHPEDVSRALWIANNWPKEPGFEKIKNDIKDKIKAECSEEMKNATGNEEQFAYLLWETMTRNPYSEDFCKRAELFAKVKGYIKKDAGTDKSEGSLTIVLSKHESEL